jgi:hypothetical protein
VELGNAARKVVHGDAEMIEKRHADSLPGASDIDGRGA